MSAAHSRASRPGCSPSKATSLPPGPAPTSSTGAWATPPATSGTRPRRPRSWPADGGRGTSGRPASDLRGAMTREELAAQLKGAGFTSGDMVYVARAGDEYRWCGADQMPADPGQVDAWIYYSGKWPTTAEDFPAFFE